MARETIRTRDAAVYVGFPTAPGDDPSVQVGVSYGESVGWAVLTSPDQVADLRRTLQRASRRVWPEAPPVVELVGQSHGAPSVVALPSDLVVPSPFGPVATGLVTPATDEPA